jgi:hypothetical protein
MVHHMMDHLSCITSFPAYEHSFDIERHLGLYILLGKYGVETGTMWPTGADLVGNLYTVLSRRSNKHLLAVESKLCRYPLLFGVEELCTHREGYLTV